VRKVNISNGVLAQGRVLYMVELARGSSYIASTRTDDTLNRAIAEVIAEFSQTRDAKELAVFLQLLALDVEKRGHYQGASALRRTAAASSVTKKGRSMAGTGLKKARANPE
jgi:hypothetical protein